MTMITDELRKFAWAECPSKHLERIIEDARTMEGCGSIGEFMERHGAELVERCKRLAGEA